MLGFRVTQFGGKDNLPLSCWRVKLFWLNKSFHTGLKLSTSMFCLNQCKTTESVPHLSLSNIAPQDWHKKQ